ncbi:MAG: hypothetical protein AAGC88_05465 [Bacteroidota bacterium]
MAPKGKEKSIFERNPKSTIAIFTATLFLFLDFLLARVLLQDHQARARLYRTQHSYYHHGLKESVSIRVSWGPERYKLVTNSLGLRSNESTNVKLQKDAKRRILVIGDSFTEGVGMSMDETFVGLAQNVLPNIELLNAGVVSYSPFLYYLKIKYLLEIVGLEVDEVIVYVDISDIQDEVIYAREKFIPKLPTRQGLLGRAKTRMTDVFINNSLLCNVLLYRVYYPFRASSTVTRSYDETRGESVGINELMESRARWTWDDETYQQWGKLGLLSARDNVSKILNLCQARNVKVTLAIYPWPEQILKVDEIDRHRESWTVFAEEMGLDLIDHYPEFLVGAPSQVIVSHFFEGDVHWNHRGHRVIADRLVRFLDP